ncbi:MAG: hypothetical protein CFE21_06275 [Bacteroidetes bacterium B1(2017)]|nr:MAG: hypothetical protein CFE21_06275 [Bacteroidetes bacterium B1(2017)]
MNYKDTPKEELVNKILELEKENLELKKLGQIVQPLQFSNKIADELPGMVYQYRLRPDGTSCFPYASDGIKYIYRVNPEDVVKDSNAVFSNLHPDDFAAITQSIIDSAKNLTLWQFKYRVKFEDGTIRWLHGNGSPELEEDGSVLWHGFITDITDAKKIEDQLLWNQSLLNLMATSSPLGFLVVDNRTDEILYFNNRFCEIWGIEHLSDRMRTGELKNNDIIPDCLPVLVDIPAFAESCKPLQFEENRVVVSDDIPFTNNRTIHRYSTQIRGDKDEYFGRFYIFEDITEKQSKVEELLENKEKHRALSEATIDSIFFSEKGICIAQNKAAEIEFGYSNKEALGRYGTDWIVPEYRDLVMKNMLSGYEKPYEVVALRKDGSTFPCMLSGRMMFYKNKNVRVTILQNISERKQAELTLLNSQIQFAKFMDFLPALVFIKNAKSEIVYCNEAMDKALGSNSWVNKPLNEIFDEETTTRIISDDQRTIKSGYEVIYESFPNLDGILRDYETRKFAIPITGNEMLLGGIALDISDRKQAEEKFERAFQSNSVLMAISSLETGKFIDVNEKLLKESGYTRDEIIGKTSKELNLFVDYDERKDIVNSAKTNINLPSSLEINLKGKRNNIITGLVSINTVQIGNETCALTAIVDITERKKMEKALHNSEEKLQTIIETSPDGVAISSMNGTIEFVTKQTTKLFGYETFEEQIGKNILDFIHPSYQTKAIHLLSEMLKGNLTGATEYLMQRKDGSTFFCEINANVLKDNFNTPKGVLYIVRDISERKKFEKELQEATTRMILATQITGVGIWDYDMAKQNLVWDDQMYKLYGFDKDDPYYKKENWRSFIHPEDGDLVSFHYQNSIQNKTQLDFAFRIIWPDKSIKHIRLMAQVHFDENDKPSHLIGTNRDITEQLLAEKETNQARKEAEAANQAKSEFLSRMSHELRTPLNSILGFAQLMDLSEQEEKKKKGLAHILNSGMHLLNLINEVLDLSKIEAGHINVSKENIKCLELINEVLDIVSPMASKNGLKISFTPFKTILPAIHSDPKLLKQVLLNLLNNALKYTPQGGSINIFVSTIPPNKKKFTSIRISICDTGNGISEENLLKIFMPFERIGAEKTSVEGTGLGLSVVRKIIAALDGQIGVKSTIGVGSTFWIDLPVASVTDGLKMELSQSKNLVTDLKDELKIHQIDKLERAAELDIANIELEFQTSEKISTAAEMVILKEELLRNRTKSNYQKITGSVLIVDDSISNIDLVRQVIYFVFPSISILHCLNGQDVVNAVIENRPSIILLDLNLPDLHGSEILKQLKGSLIVKDIPVVIISADATEKQINSALAAGAANYLTKPLNLELFIQTIFKLLS